MPLIDSDFHAPPWLFNGHLQTIYPALLRRVPAGNPQRFSIPTQDGDFLVIDHYQATNSQKAIIISHGLEGNSEKPYVVGMAKQFLSNGWHAFAWNYRGCSGRLNKTLRFYHSGATDDLEVVVQHVLSRGFKQVALVGFSMGGNLTLKYLGERSEKLPSEIRSSTVFSVPLDLKSGCLNLNKSYNRIYELRFLRSLKEKVRQKAEVMHGLDTNKLKKIRTLYQFDDIFTAPLHGFRNADDYYQQCSALYFLDRITIPTLIVNAKNDPMLTPECFPYPMLEKHPFVFFESPSNGGHVGFASSNGRDGYWSEERAVKFVESHYGPAGH